MKNFLKVFGTMFTILLIAVVICLVLSVQIEFKQALIALAISFGLSILSSVIMGTSLEYKRSEKGNMIGLLKIFSLIFIILFFMTFISMKACLVSGVPIEFKDVFGTSIVYFGLIGFNVLVWIFLRKQK